MTRLTVSVSGQWHESRLLTLPVDVYAPDGTLLASGTASPGRPAYFELPQRQDRQRNRAYVLGKLPNGTILQQTAELNDELAEATLRLGDESPHEWLQWVTPFHSLDHLRNRGDASKQSSRRIGKVWMTLWGLHGGRWKGQEVEAVERHRDDGMQQWVLDVPSSSQLLQIGGEEVAWRLVSLPPGGRVRVALTRTAGEKGDSLDITVGRSQPDNELIMSYLARGAIAEAGRLGEVWNAADLVLYAKKRDPVAAAAGAYLLLKNRRLQARRKWVDNLVEWFPHLPDGAIVSAALALQRDDATEFEIRTKLDLALNRGLPVFAMGATVLVETMAAVHRGKRETKRFHAAYLAAQAYARARCSNGAYLAFYGKSPAEPSWTPIYGLQNQPSGNPASASPADTVVYSRPWGGIQAGKFGSTRVALPRAPVNRELVEALRVKSNRLENVPGQLQVVDPLFHHSVNRGVPIIETSFLQEFSVPSERGEELVAHDALAPSREVPHIKQEGSSAPRQTAKYWRQERLKHATTVFDDE